jgi:carbamoyl-phosphate synthase large subunit
MNPRVSRSSALASKATGFPIAKIAALLAVGYTLDEIPNDITRVTPASFEPSLDYCVVKVPRFVFEKFPGADASLGPQMKSVGEVMAIGRTFPEALNKALRGLELKQEARSGLQLSDLATPTARRIFDVLDALRQGATLEEIVSQTKYDPWFVAQMQRMIDVENELRAFSLGTVPIELLKRAKRFGLSDLQIANLLNDKMTRYAWQADQLVESTSVSASSFHSVTPSDVRTQRLSNGIIPAFYRIDTCAAEFEAFTPYLYSTYERGDEATPTNNRKVIILGGGPNRIGQGIEFDYCCVQACYALKQLG